MRIIIFGATGGTGREAVYQAAAHGHVVRAFVRNAARFQADPEIARMVDTGVLEVVEGNALDAAAVAGAIRGCEAVLSSLGAHPPWRPTEICRTGITHIIAGMRAHKLRRLVALSTLGAGETRAEAPWFARNVIYRFMLSGVLPDKDEMERSVRASDLDWTIVRPTLLTKGRPRGRIRATVNGDIKSGSISRADVAAFCLGQLESQDYLRRAPVITG